MGITTKSHTITIYREVHQRLQNKMLMDIANNNLQNKIEKAKQMEQILKSIKKTDITQTNNTLENVLARRTLELLNQARAEENLRQFTGKLFRRRHTVEHLAGSDDIFEDELVALFTAIENSYTKRNIDLKSKLAGNEGAKVSNIVYDIAEQVYSNGIENVQKELKKKSAQIKNKSLTFTNINVTSGKIDVYGTTPIDITAKTELVARYEKLYELFKGAKFTVKNYSSYSMRKEEKNIVNLHLGNTVQYKVIASVLSSLGGELAKLSIIKKVFYATNNILQKGGNNATEIKQHLFHVRFAYELAGYGLSSKLNDEDLSADYIIYNDPATDNIIVRSTASIVYGIINSNLNRHISATQDITISTDRLAKFSSLFNPILKD